MTVYLSELETARLRLRKLRREDAKAFFSRLASSEAVTQYMLWKPHKDISESVASIEKVLRRYETGESCRWAITVKDTGELIGIIDLLGFEEETKSCTFAYMLGRDFWNRGYGTEAVKAVFRFAFEALKMESITADHFAENPASGAVMAKAGMEYLGCIPDKYEKNGHLHDAHTYRITYQQWNMQKGG